MDWKELEGTQFGRALRIGRDLGLTAVWAYQTAAHMETPRGGSAGWHVGEKPDDFPASYAHDDQKVLHKEGGIVFKTVPDSPYILAYGFDSPDMGSAIIFL